MACKYCGAMHSEREWKSGTGEWVARVQNKKVRGFHLNELASPWKRWNEIVEDFVTAERGGPEKLKVWINTSLGETWEEKGTGVDADDLIKRREQYAAEVPNDVLLLTCGVDVQGNRLEYEVVGWGPDAKSWGVRYGVIMGDPGQNYVWEMLDTQVITNTFRRADGQQLQVMTTCVDSGGHNTKEVYTACKKREARRVWAIKGRGGSGIPFITRPKKRNDEGAWLFIIGVDVGKDTLSSRLAVRFEDKPGYCHFPMKQDAGYEEDYFHQITSEHRVRRMVKGRAVYHWELRIAGSRNEALDCRNYATAALEIMGGEPTLATLQRMREEAEGAGSNSVPIKKPVAKRRGKVNKGVEV